LRLLPIDPDILLLDEVLGAGDAAFAERAEARMKTLVQRTRILVLASHSDTLIKMMCTRLEPHNFAHGLRSRKLPVRGQGPSLCIHHRNAESPSKHCVTLLPAWFEDYDESLRLRA
jgi:hypothetical protein